jgi:translation elongation factor EF-G
MEWLKNNSGLVIEILVALFIVGSWIWDKFNKAYKLRKSNEDFHGTVENHTKQIVEMDIRHKEDYQKLDNKLDTIIYTMKEYQEETKDYNEKLRRAMIEQMSSDITSLCECYLERKSVESYELTALINQYTVYEEIGGNHGVHELVEKVRLLPVEHKHKSE